MELSEHRTLSPFLLLFFLASIHLPRFYNSWMLLDVSCVSGKRVEIVLCNADELYGFQIETGKLGEKRIDAMYLGRPDIFLPFPFFSLLFFFIFLFFYFCNSIQTERLCIVDYALWDIEMKLTMFQELLYR